MTTPAAARDLTRTSLALLFIGILIAGSFLILRPFLPALIWATTVVIATWPVMRAIEYRLKGRRLIATLIMSLILLLLLVIPLTLAIGAIVEHGAEIALRIGDLSTAERPPPPEWLKEIPVAGSRLVATWRKISAADRDDVIAYVAPHARNFTGWFVAQLGSFGMILVHFLITVILSAILYYNGETASRGVLRFAERLAGDQGTAAARLAAQSIRAVALGVVGTALFQSAFAGIGLIIAGVPQALLLTTVIFLFCVIQVGPIPVMIPIIGWLFWSDQSGLGVVIIVWTIVLAVMDNLVRPLLIKRGANLPLLLIFAGVIGGLLAFGIIGLFVGPVLLAVTYTLLNAWIDAGAESQAAATRE